MAPRPARILPVVDRDNEPFWTWGAEGKLAIYRCDNCANYVHPPVPFCPKCESRNVVPQAVSGRGRVISFTVNHKQWVPDLPVPYVLALVAIDEQEDVHIPCNIVGCVPEEVTFNMAVEAVYEQQDNVWIPFFRPAVQP